ncbi:oxygen-insensitive NADPH nitroreductase [Gorillibacterium sp. sgz5001074]|uniref:oxygen-insensitive NADPH nitroreductase n=1 Tax=Gorillibacterium sp. sgz5001074 TaxID=3446695 RepID=UPI003F66901E
MNDFINLLQRHRSIRKYTDRPVTGEQLRTIVSAAQHASTSSNIQAYSIIHVSDPAAKERLSAIAGHQAYVRDCPAFLVWCADIRRLLEASGLEAGSPEHQAASTELFIAAVADTALASQNAAIAAESMGLGIVYIGGIRNDLEEVCLLLEVPELVLPLYGMCIGYPDQDPMPRPRLPLEAVLHENTYKTDRYPALIEAYDAVTQEYYLQRTQGQRRSGWSDEMRGKLLNLERMYLKEFVRKRGFDL